MLPACRGSQGTSASVVLSGSHLAKGLPRLAAPHQDGKVTPCQGKLLKKKKAA